MSILNMVQEKYPQIQGFMPASRPLEVPIKAKHRKGAKANHNDCTISRAVKEITGADDVFTTRSSVIVVKNGRATQYEHGSGSRDIVTINDTRGEVVEQTVWLNAPNQKQQVLSMLRGKKDGVAKRTLETMFSQTATRINELRNAGYEISSQRGCDGRVTYRLEQEPKKPQAGKKYLPRTERKYRKVEKADVLRERA